MRQNELTKSPTNMEEEIILVSGEELAPDPYEPANGGLERVRFLWSNRRIIGRSALLGLVVGLIAAFVIPKEYESTTRLMAPDSSSTSGSAMLAALSTKVPGLSAYASSLFGLQNAGALFVEVLGSRTLE